jgi:predicted RNA-binding protein YlqC (UPF0109 family)
VNDVEQSSSEYIENLVKTMACGLVDDTDGVVIKVIPGEHTTVYELYVSRADRGKVIGRQGRNAQAIRTIMNAAATKSGRRVVLEIVEN